METGRGRGSNGDGRGRETELQNYVGPEPTREFLGAVLLLTAAVLSDRFPQVDLSSSAGEELMFHPPNLKNPRRTSCLSTSGI